MNGHRSQVRWGLIYRSDDLADLTDADMMALSSLGLATAVDFRGPEEIEKTGPNRLLPSTLATNLPLLDESGNALAATIQRALASGDPTVIEETARQWQSRSDRRRQLPETRHQPSSTAMLQERGPAIGRRYPHTAALPAQRARTVPA